MTDHLTDQERAWLALANDEAPDQRAEEQEAVIALCAAIEADRARRQEQPAKGEGKG